MHADVRTMCSIFSSGVASTGICTRVLNTGTTTSLKRRTNLEGGIGEVCVEADGVNADAKERDGAHADADEREGRERGAALNLWV
jgi:hypothetical protein